MKNNIYLLILLLIVGVIGYSIYYYHNTQIGYQQKNSIIKNHLSQAKKILDNTPIIPDPGGDIIYYTSTGLIVTKKQDYDIIAGYLRGPELKKLNLAFQEPYNNKYYRYAIKRDGSAYQIGGVIISDDEYISIITGNSQQDLLLDYTQKAFVQNLSSTKYPYNPYTKYITATFRSLNLGEDGILKVLDQSGKGHTISAKNIDNFVIKPFDTIIMKGENAQATILFENGDTLELKGDSVLKIQQSQINNENNAVNFFWLIGKIIYQIYDDEGEVKIHNPIGSIGIQGDILQGTASISGDSYEIQSQTSSGDEITQSHEQKYDAKIFFDMDELMTDKSNQADILQGQQIDIQDMIKILK